MSLQNIMILNRFFIQILLIYIGTTKLKVVDLYILFENKLFKTYGYWIKLNFIPSYFVVVFILKWDPYVVNAIYTVAKNDFVRQIDLNKWNFHKYCSKNDFTKHHNLKKSSFFYPNLTGSAKFKMIHLYFLFENFLKVTDIKSIKSIKFM